MKAKQLLDSYLNLIRFDKPVGTLLILYPTLVALWLASNGIPDWRLLVIFVAGSFIMRSAGCIINDILDKDFDKSVARTKNRPLANGELTVTQALMFLLLLLACALLLVLQLNTNSLLVAVVALICTLTYPLFKRFTYFPQLFLGIAINLGVLLAFTAVTNTITNLSLVVLATAAVWTLIYDSHYAKLDLDDDLIIGVKSTAIAFGKQFNIILVLLRFLLLLGMLACGYLANLAISYYLFLIVIAMLLFIQSYTTWSNAKQAHFKAFTNCHYIGLLWWLSIVLSFEF